MSRKRRYWTLFAKEMTGKTSTFEEVDKYMTVRDLKKVVQDKTCFPFEKQKLLKSYFGGDEYLGGGYSGFDDSKRLFECNLHHEGQFYLYFRMENSKPSPGSELTKIIDDDHQKSWELEDILADELEKLIEITQNNNNNDEEEKEKPNLIISEKMSLIVKSAENGPLLSILSYLNYFDHMTWVPLVSKSFLKTSIHCLREKIVTFRLEEWRVIQSRIFHYGRSSSQKSINKKKSKFGFSESMLINRIFVDFEDLAKRRPMDITNFMIGRKYFEAIEVYFTKFKDHMFDQWCWNSVNSAFRCIKHIKKCKDLFKSIYGVC